MIMDWTALPSELSHLLLKGGVGKAHLLHIADTALRLAQHPAPRAEWYGWLGADALLAAWEQDMLDAQTAGQLVSLHAVRPFLRPDVLAVAEQVRTSAERPENLSYLTRLLQRREKEKIFHFLEQQREKEPDSLFWTTQALLVGFYEADYERLADWLNGDRALPTACRERVAGDVAFACGRYIDAAECYAKAEQLLPVVTHTLRHAEAAYRAGDRTLAEVLWRVGCAKRPWCLNAALRLHDVLNGADRACVLPEGPGAALLYTWNKAAYLDTALACIAASDMGNAKVVVLDNGSTDTTPQVLSAWRERMGQDRMEIITLPLNVGAPAARNWLMQAKTLADCRWLAYLDDDAMLPPDWLGRFGAAMHMYPDALAWGCKVVDHDNPMVLQSVDLHLTPGGETTPAPDGWGSYTRRFRVSDLHHQDLDFGWFDYMRPCASVTGCTHVFLRERLMRHGGFDLRFSPSQYDDLEHDLRGVVHGTLPVYTGHLRVTHMKRTGKASHTERAEFGNSYANMLKLQMKYTAQEFDAMRRNDEEAARADILNKLAQLDA